MPGAVGNDPSDVTVHDLHHHEDTSTPVPNIEKKPVSLVKSKSLSPVKPLYTGTIPKVFPPLLFPKPLMSSDRTQLTKYYSVNNVSQGFDNIFGNFNQLNRGILGQGQDSSITNMVPTKGQPHANQDNPPAATNIRSLNKVQDSSIINVVPKVGQPHANQDSPPSAVTIRSLI